MSACTTASPTEPAAAVAARTAARPPAPAGTAGFVVFSDDWGVHPSSCQHLFRHIASRHRVIWVNTIGLRAPTLSWSDARKAWRKLGGMLGLRPRPPLAAPAGPLVLQPPMLPFAGLRLVRWINRLLVTACVRKVLRREGIVAPVLVTTVPNACDVVGHLGEHRVVYYCVDDLANWPGLAKATVGAMEAELEAKADVFVATSQRLFQRLAKHGRPTHLLTHGVDLAMFSTPAVAEHACLAGLARPRVGCFGLFDERNDQPLLAALAALLPDHVFVIAGPVAVPVTLLQRQPNIRFTGALPYGELPALAKGLDVLLIPYRLDVLAQSISPLKLKEYLATGKPVVSTPMEEVLRMGPLVATGATPSTLAQAIRHAARTVPGERLQAVRELLAGEDWSVKAQCLLACCGVAVDGECQAGVP